MIDKKQNVYFVHKETGETFSNNIVFGNYRNIGTGCAVVFPLTMSAENGYRSVGREINPNDYHIIPGAVLEIDKMIDASLDRWGNNSVLESLQLDIFDKFMPEKMSKSQYETMENHYRECENDT